MFERLRSLLESIIYDVVCSIYHLATNIFFREVLKRGSHQIPEKGSIIFVAAPHANQFVDPLVIMQTCPRPLKFLMAASSMRKGVPGFFGRLLRCISVERAMDLAKHGIGTVFGDEMDPLRIYGKNTKFLQQFSAQQTSLAINIPPDTFSSIVAEIKSDSLLLLKKPLGEPASTSIKDPNGSNFMILPTLDQSEVYNAVFEVLERGECIGIFPEGGSHDRAEMLPLKAGVTVMALGAMARNQDIDVTIVPCGLNYFNPDKFRSRAIVEYGEPVRVDRKLVELFKLGGNARREACGRLLNDIYYSLCSVTINVPDYETLQLVQATRRLYQPLSRKLNTFESLEVTRRFIKGYMAFKDQPKIKQLLNAILEYNKVLKHFHLYDHQVKTFQVSGVKAIMRLISQLLLLALYGVTILPALLLNLPIMLAIDYISKKKAKRAAASSTVKLKGRDVLATWKLMVGFVLFPTMYIIYCFPVSYKMYQSGVSLPRIIGIIGFLAGVVLPSLSYIMVLIAEHGFETYLSIRPLWYSVIRPHYGEVIRSLRHRLKLELIRTVDEYGPKLISDFDKARIVPSRRKSMGQNDWKETGNLKSPVPMRHKIIPEEEGIEEVIEKAKSISRENSPSLGLEGLDAVMSGFQYMRASVNAALTNSGLDESSQTLKVDDWSYVEPIEIDDIFFTRATVFPTQKKKQE